LGALKAFAFIRLPPRSHGFIAVVDEDIFPNKVEMDVG
jgi:hypothetical protein